MFKLTVRCKDCDCQLFSAQAKELELCPECQGDNEEFLLDLEDQLEKLFENKT